MWLNNIQRWDSSSAAHESVMYSFIAITLVFTLNQSGSNIIIPESLLPVPPQIFMS